MNASVVIVLPPSDASSPFAPVLASACSASLQSTGTCTFNVGDAARAGAIAVVWWREDGRLARLQFAQNNVRKPLDGVDRPANGAASLPRTFTRELEFAAETAPSERWRAVGITLGILAGETGNEGGGESSVEIAKRAPQRASDRYPRWIDATGLVASGASGGMAAVGGLRLAWAPSDGSWFVPLSAQFAQQSALGGDALLRWVDGSIGVGVRFGPGNLGISAEASVEGYARLAMASGPDPHASRGNGTGGPTSGSRWLFGPRATLGMGWMWGSRIGITAQVGTGRSQGATKVKEYGVTVGELPAETFCGQLGMRIAF